MSTIRSTRAVAVDSLFVATSVGAPHDSLISAIVVEAATVGHAQMLLINRTDEAFAVYYIDAQKLVYFQPKACPSYVSARVRDQILRRNGKRITVQDSHGLPTQTIAFPDSGRIYFVAYINFSNAGSPPAVGLGFPMAEGEDLT